jgi:hypothetical protein
MPADPFVVLCWENEVGWIPPIRISANQFTIGLRYAAPAVLNPCPVPPDVIAPLGAFDLEALLRSSGIATKPDLIVVWSSALHDNRPANLRAFRCPKLLICGDTHHLDRPIRTMIDYAGQEAFDAVASAYDRHHLHWFLASGFQHCAWLPGITVQDIAPPWQARRTDQVAFVGQFSAALHGWRRAVLERMASAGIPVRAERASRAEAASLYAESLVSFNGSLNGDLNMRVFEVLSAGGFLLTDRLSPQAGLDLLFRPGQDCETYADADEAMDKLEFYRTRPAAALRIAEQGAATYRRAHRAEDRIAVLRRWMLDGHLPDLLNPRHDLRLATSQADRRFELRLAAYEMLQDRQRIPPTVRVLAEPGWPAASVLDLLDLCHTQVSVVGPAPDLRMAAAAASVGEQVVVIEPDEAARQDWDIVLTTRPGRGEEPWRQRAERLVFADFGTAL